MNIDLTSFAFGSSLSNGGGTPSWGTALGQSKPDYKFTHDGAEEILIGMTYCSIPLEFITLPMGKGGKNYNAAETHECQLAAEFKKVFINGQKIDHAFLMVLVKESSDSHAGRKSIKYSDKICYKNNDTKIEYSNEGFISQARITLGLNENSCWFVYSIEVHNQDELHMFAAIADKDKNVNYTNSNSRKDAWSKLIPDSNIQKQVRKENDMSDYKEDISPIIYYGAPGTGKTRHVQINIYDKYPTKNRIFTTFHQSFSYEEFVEGLKPILDNNDNDVKYHIESGVFYNACERAAIIAGYNSLSDCISAKSEDRKEKFDEAIASGRTMLLCIDEINRGNVASIFGDLISLIESSKRLGAGEYEMIATLPYSKRKFGVPSNLFVVGTMNTADRSIQLIDSALRRRFRFEELSPKYDAINNEKAQKILKVINNRIRCLLNKDYQIGHSYFINVQDDKNIFDVIVSKIIPLLEEYFYNDIEKIRFVLNENTKTRYNFYEEDLEARKSYENFTNIGDMNDEEKSFFVLKSKTIIDAAKSKYLYHLIDESEPDSE